MSQIIERPGRFFRLGVVAVTSIATVVTVMSLLALLYGCGGANPSIKPTLRAIDEHVQLACEGLAQALAQQSGADAQRIVETTCAIEAVTRTMRELLLSKQIEAAKRAGVLVPNINSGQLEASPYDRQDAE